jgi:integrase
MPKLTEKFANEAMPEPGKRKASLHDGDGLYLIVRRGRDGKIYRSWFRREGNRWMGLGRKSLVTVEAARLKNKDAALKAHFGRDLIAENKAAAREKKQSKVTLSQAKDAFFEKGKETWRPNTLRRVISVWTNHLSTQMGHVPIRNITRDEVLKHIKPLWYEHPVTANAARWIIERSLALYEINPNPATFRGNLDVFLDPLRKVRAVRHPRQRHKALPYRDVPAFMAELEAKIPGMINDRPIAARCLQFCILNAVRANEAAFSTWDEFDLVQNVWTISRTRMKVREEHQVPLSRQSLGVLAAMARGHRLVFPAHRIVGHVGKPISILRDEFPHLGPITVHGFRSSFKDWASAQNKWQLDLIELSLAHVEPGVGADYRRDAQVGPRTPLMEAWGTYCFSLTPGGMPIFDPAKPLDLKPPPIGREEVARICGDIGVSEGTFYRMRRRGTLPAKYHAPPLKDNGGKGGTGGPPNTTGRPSWQDVQRDTLFREARRLGLRPRIKRKANGGSTRADPHFVLINDAGDVIHGGTTGLPLAEAVTLCLLLNGEEVA